MSDGRLSLKLKVGNVLESTIDDGNEFDILKVNVPLGSEGKTIDGILLV